MAEGTKERILRTALELFAQNGYLGTSMNDIAGQLGITKAALYKHYASKQEILDKIVERMNKMDYERAEAYEMPETEPDGFAEAYLHTPIQKIRTYSLNLGNKAINMCRQQRRNRFLFLCTVVDTV